MPLKIGLMRIAMSLSLIFWYTALCAQFQPESQGEIVSHQYYTLSFNDTHKQANWVYYVLSLKEQPLKAERKDNFRVDKSVSTGSATPSDYAKSGYDRGHLCPAADMSFSEGAMSETFYMSNMSPQAPAFNRGIWKQLEERVRDWGRCEQIYVVTGPVFRELKGAVGKNRVSIPGYFYKVIYSPARELMIAFILPNEKGTQTLDAYVLPVDEVEAQTGIDFFPQLTNTLENRLESQSDYTKWH